MALPVQVFEAAGVFYRAHEGANISLRRRLLRNLLPGLPDD
jgi:hypothetical protein